jgi:TonB family protein
VKLQGVVVLQIVVDSDGRPRNITVVKSLGLGLDDRAMETVRTWRFKPGTSGGKPVPTMAVIEVNFRLL